MTARHVVATGLAAAFLGAGVVLAPAVAAPVADREQPTSPEAGAAEPAAPQQPNTQPAAAPSASGQSVRLLVKFRNEATAAGALRAAGGSELRMIGDIGIHVITVPSEHAAAALSALRSNASVAWAERDGLLKPQEILPNDPFFPQQYALSGGAWGWYQTHTTQAWDITQGDPSVVVAVLDTGVRDVPDMAGQVVAGWNVLNASADTSTNAGVHGTYVAGAIGLALGNAAGNAGYCPGCRIMPVQVGTDSGAYISDVATGIAWAADHGARVENLSLAGSSASSALTNAVSYARSKGVVVVAAAGNSNCDCVTYPAATSGVLGVAGTDNVGNKQGDSNYGSWVMLAAPEANMTGWPSINGAPGYAPVGGTSLAAPVVAGIAGLVFSYDRSLSGAQVEQALETTAVPASFTVKYGRVDALAALLAVGATDPQPSSAPLNVGPPQVFVSTNSGSDTAPLTTAPQAGQVLVRGQGAWLGSAPLSLVAVQWQHCNLAGASCTTVGTSAKYTVQSSDSGYVLRVVVTVKNGLGSTTVASPITLAVGGATSSPPPANTSLPTISGTPQEGETLSASTGGWSGSPTSYAYQWQRCDLNGAACAPVLGGTTSSYALASADVGDTLRVVVTATNASGSASATSAPSGVVSPAPAPAPTTQTLTFSGSLNGKSPVRTFTVNVGAGLADARLSFSKCSSLSLGVQSTAGAAVATKTGPSVVVLDATLGAGGYSYSVSGGRCSFTLTVTSPSP
jgi:Subtilase family